MCGSRSEPLTTTDPCGSDGARRSPTRRRTSTRSRPTQTMSSAGWSRSPIEGGEPPATGPAEGRLFAGTGAIDHVEVISGERRRRRVAARHGGDALVVGPGDEVCCDRAPVRFAGRVDGVYTSLYTQPRQGYWRLWNDEIYPCPGVTCSAPPQFIIADLDQLLDLSSSLGFGQATFAWQAPARTDPPLTLADADALATSTGRILDRMTEGGPLGPLFHCCGQRFLRGGSTEITVRATPISWCRRCGSGSPLCRAPCWCCWWPASRSRSPSWPPRGSSRSSARRVEMGVLTIRGWGPVAFGAKVGWRRSCPPSSGASSDGRSRRRSSCPSGRGPGGGGRPLERLPRGRRRRAGRGHDRRRGVGRRLRRPARASAAADPGARRGAVGARRVRAAWVLADRLEAGARRRVGRHRTAEAGGVPVPARWWLARRGHPVRPHRASRAPPWDRGVVAAASRRLGSPCAGCGRGRP